MLSSTVTETSLSQVFRQFWLRFYCTSLWTEEREYNTELNSGSSNSTNHKNYNFLACDWFKTRLPSCYRTVGYWTPLSPISITH